jgi:hypothetical protein
MNLTTDEILKVDQQLSAYNIKFQEIYDELKDHILTAIETRRADGDGREIDVLFNEVIQKQFPGYWPFEEIVKQHRLAYGHKIWRAFWLNYKHYFTWETIPLMALLLASSFYLPQTKPIMAVLLITLLLLSMLPVVYIAITGRKIKTDKGKHSLVKAYVLNCSNLLMIVFNFLFNSIRLLSQNWARASFLDPRHYSPAIYMLLIILAFVYCLSIVRLSRDEFKIAG